MDGNLKLILGVVWTLIQHYSISTPVWEDEANNSVSKLTPEMRLLGWIQNKVPELPITNFNQDWQDGKALGALVDGLAPGKPLSYIVLFHVISIFLYVLRKKNLLAEVCLTKWLFWFVQACVLTGRAGTRCIG